MEDEKPVQSPLNLGGLREGTMLTEDQWGTIRTLYDRGVGKKTIARMLGVDVKTVRRHLRQGERVAYQRQTKRGSLLDPFRERLQLAAPGVNYCAQVLFQRIREMGYSGGYELVKLFVRPLRQEQRRLEEATVRFETGPGKQSQVDWGSAEVNLGGQWVRVQIFVMVLGYSRGIYAHGVLDQKLPSLIRCHEQSWDWFGGRTEEILYDNPKTICLKRDMEGKHIEWNPVFMDFSRYYGFRAMLCRPYRARTKGKVESGVKYVKRNFLAGRSFHSLAHLNEELERWIRTVADVRIHGTTHQRPVDLLKEEPLISTAGGVPYQVQRPLSRQVASDSLVCVDTNRYSVPHRYVGQQVDVVFGEGDLRIYHEGECIAQHPLQEGKHQRCLVAAHYEGLFPYSAKTNPLKEAPCLGMNPWPPEDVEIRSLSVYEGVCGAEAFALEGGAL